MRKYLCLSYDDHTPETEREIATANTGICPFCGSEMVWEDYEDEKEEER